MYGQDLSPGLSYIDMSQICGLASYAYSFNYLVANPNPMYTSVVIDNSQESSTNKNSSSASYGWHMQYLTIIGLSLATATFTAGLLADITTSPRLFA